MDENINYRTIEIKQEVDSSDVECYMQNNWNPSSKDELDACEVILNEDNFPDGHGDYSNNVSKVVAPSSSPPTILCRSVGEKRKRGGWSDAESEQQANKRVNFTKRERSVLIYLVNKYKHIVENKMTNNAANKEKNECWNQISAQFNAVVDTHRNGEQLKKLWSNEKMKSKKIKGKSLHQTGGGPPDKSDDVNSSIMDILGPSVTGLDNIFDSDGRIICDDNLNTGEASPQVEMVDLAQDMSRGPHSPIGEAISRQQTLSAAQIIPKTSTINWEKKKRTFTDGLTSARIKASNAAAELAELEVQSKQQQRQIDFEIKRETAKLLKKQQELLQEKILTMRVERRKFELECKVLEKSLAQQ